MPVFPVACNKRSLIQTPRFAHNQWFPHEGTGVITSPTKGCCQSGQQEIDETALGSLWDRRWLTDFWFAARAVRRGAVTPTRHRMVGIRLPQPVDGFCAIYSSAVFCLAMTALKFMTSSALTRTKDCAGHDPVYPAHKVPWRTAACITLGCHFASSP